MADEITATPTPEEVVTADLSRYPELLPGGAEALGKAWGQSLGTMRPEDRAAELEKRMSGPLAARYANPEYQAQKTEDGSPLTPLRAILGRHSDRLAPGAVDDLVVKLASQTNGKAAPEVAKIVARFLGSREADPHLASAHQHGISQSTAAALDRLGEHFPDVPYNARLKIAEERGRDLARVSDQVLVTTIASALRSPAVASRFGTAALDQADPRLQPSSALSPKRAAPVQPERGPDGRFASPPTPGRRRSGL